MPARKTYSLKQEEHLCEVIRKYPVIYDKSMSGYKENVAVDNAWNDVSLELEFIEDGKHSFFLVCLFSTWPMKSCTS